MLFRSAPSSPPTYRQPRRRPTQPSDTRPRALGSRNFVRILLASWLRWQLWSNCVWLKVFKVAKRQCGDHVTNPFRVDSTHCTMVPLSIRSCLKSNKLRPILNGQFYPAIFKNIGLNLFGSKQPREILVFVILKL